IMKRYRSALMAGLLALAVAVCDDDGTVVQPPPVVNVSPPDVTVTVPPAPPAVAPLQAMITPPAAEVGVDGMVDFAVGTSGGSGDASWTCTSSDVAVATVEKTDTGCRATAVAGGGATITAAVTKGSESTNVAAQLTVSTTTDAFVLVTDISGDNDSDASGLMGTVTVTVSVERGSQTFEKLSLNVDGMEVDAQDFGTAAADDAEQTVHEFKLSFESAEYDEMGMPDYMNGDHSIQALLKIAGRDDALMSNVLDVVFDNDDGYVVTADLGDYSMLDDEGRRWYGGPANGDIMISAMAVIYSGDETGAVAISLAGCEAEAAGDASFEFDCDGEDADRMITVTEGGNDVMVLNDLPTANIDMEGPAMAPYFSPNPNNRQNGWVNATVDFGGEQKSDNKDGWLMYNKADPEPGVGGYMPVLRYAKADGNSVEDAIAAAPLSLMNFPGESDMDYYCGVVSAVDALGNESDLPDEDDGTCVTAGMPDADAGTDTDNNTNDATGYEMLLEALAMANRMPADVAPATAKADAIEAAQMALANAGILAGVDLTPPGIEIDEEMRLTAIPADGFSFDIYDDENDEANSGLHSLAPLLVRIQRRTTDKTECLAIDDLASATATPAGTPGEVDNGDDVSCTADPSALADGTAITFSTTPATSHAYYTLTGSAVDQAGNFAMPVSHTLVFDNSVATATAPAAPAIEAGETFQIASFLNDDLSIREYYVTADFGADILGVTGPISLGVVHPTMVDEFNAPMLTHRNYSVTADIETYAGLQENVAATDVTELATVSVVVRDQADSDGTNNATPSAALTVEAADDPFEGTGTDPDNFTVAFTADEAAICAAEDTGDCEPEAVRDETSTELEVVVTAGGDGAFSDPFERVDFWMRDVNGHSWMLGSDTSGESGRVDGARTRTWTYSMEFSAAMLYMMTREAAFPPTADSDSHTVLAFGVNDDGIAIVMSVAIDIDDGEDDQ
ncbi:MAG: hypothetical protein OXI46_07580, partial [Gemmatimonadota bacterium]|nr:hypothetical protein [Gemmatimonadota bacterium]